MLDGSNYDDWKPRMIAFLRSLDSKVWRAVNKGWEHPTKTGEDGVSVQIPEEEWDKEQEALALGNSKALNALFNGISKNIFRLVHHCELAKEVWDTLKITHEGTSKVRMSKLQMLDGVEMDQREGMTLGVSISITVRDSNSIFKENLQAYPLRVWVDDSKLAHQGP